MIRAGPKKRLDWNGRARIAQVARTSASRFFMILGSILVFVAVAFWRAGWRKGLEISGISSIICFIFALTFSVNVWDVPRNLWNALRATLHFPAYFIRHPAQWLNLVTPVGIVAAVWLLFIALRRLRKLPATDDEDTLE